MEEKAKKTNILVKLLEAFIEIFIGLFKGFKYLMTILPVSVIAIIFCFIFFKEQTISAFEFLTSLFS